MLIIDKFIGNKIIKKVWTKQNSKFFNLAEAMLLIREAVQPLYMSTCTMQFYI